MVKHVILWKLKDEYSGIEIEKIKQGIKEGYSTHPLHVDVATTKVHPYTSSRTCMDYEV